MRLLVKFTDYADDFQNGKLYMNTLNYFWKNGFEEQKDIMEGIGATVPIALSSIHIPDNENHVLSDYAFRADGFGYCNVFCMYSMEINYNGITASFNTSSEMKNFGKYAVVVNDEAEFYRRINIAAKNHKYLCGNVNYHSNTLKQHHLILECDKSFDLQNVITRNTRDSFDKSDKYRTQSEWRLTLYRGIKSIDSYILNIGDIHDITTCIKSKDFEWRINNHISKTKFYRTNELFYGNINRRELRKLFIELGDNKAKLFFAFG